MNWKTTIVICSLILLLAFSAMAVIHMTEPEAQKTSASKRTAMLVEVTRGETGTFRPEVRATGTVRPEKEIVLSPRVSGEITSISDAFTPGGFVEAGEVLVQIDPADYEVILLQRQSELHQATADLELELGRQDLALKDYRELKGSSSSEFKALALRKPQLDTAESRVEAAEAAVRRAELDLERTRIRAPFAAHILNRDVNIGSQVSAGQPLGELVGTEQYWVVAKVPVSELRWIDFSGETGANRVQVRNRSAWPEDSYREGSVHRLVGELEDQTRLARVLLTVNDPLAHDPSSAGLPVMMIGSFVEARIAGAPLENVTRVARDYVRKEDTAWVYSDGVLEIRELDIVFRDQQFAYVSSGLSAEDRIITTNLATVFNGADLRLADALQ